MNKPCSNSEQNSQTRRGHQRKGKKGKQGSISSSYLCTLQYKTIENPKPTRNTCPSLITFDSQNQNTTRNLSEVGRRVVPWRVKELLLRPQAGLVGLCAAAPCGAWARALTRELKGGSRHDSEASPRQGEGSGLYSVRKRKRQGLSKRGGRYSPLGTTNRSP